MPGPPQIYTKGHKDRQQGAEPCSSSQICPLPLPTSENFGKKHQRQGAYGHSLPIPTPLMMVSLPLIALDGIFFFLLLMLLSRFWKQMKLLSSTRSAGNKLHNSNTNWGAGWLVRGWVAGKHPFVFILSPLPGEFPGCFFTLVLQARTKRNTSFATFF